MAQRPTPQIGDRIAIARRRRGMSRKALAHIVGRSEEWLRQIENGQRRLDSIEYAVRIGHALRIGNIWAFLGLEEAGVGSPSTDIKAIAHIREALLDSVLVQAFMPQPAWDEAAVTIEADVAEARRRWLGEGDRYHRTLSLLPRLLRGAACRLHTVGGVATEPVVAAYHLVRTVLSRVGEEHLALIAADRALSAAERIDGAALVAASWHVSACYLEQGSLIEAYRFALAADGQLSEGLQDGPLLSGALYLMAADAAAAMLEAHRAYDLLGEARRIAASVSDVMTPYLVPFGPTEVGIYSVQVAIRLGHPGEAIRLASQIDIPEDYPADRQARHYIPLAYLHSRRNEDAAAVFALTKVAALSPEDIRYDHQSRDTLYRLLRRNNLTVRRELARLAHIAGIS
jgi:transcriptional regulator with XRE-family HTH domain